MSKKILTVNPEDAASVLAVNRQFFTDHLAQLNGMMDKVPEALRPIIEAMKTRADAALVRLADRPTDQVPAAQAVGGAIQSLCYTVSYMQEALNDALGRIQETLADFSPKVAQLNALHTRIENKELIEKSEHEAALETARTAARTAAEQEFATLEKRRAQLCAAGLPAPEDSKLLAGEEKEFTPRLEEWKQRQAKLAALPRFSQLNTARVAQAVYGPANLFELALEFAGGPALSRPDPDPLIGAGGSTAATVMFVP